MWSQAAKLATRPASTGSFQVAPMVRLMYLINGHPLPHPPRLTRLYRERSTRIKWASALGIGALATGTLIYTSLHTRWGGVHCQAPAPTGTKPAPEGFEQDLGPGEDAAHEEPKEEAQTRESAMYQEVAEFSDMKIFTGSTHPELANEICVHLGTTLGRARVLSFDDGETFVQVMDEVRGRDVFVVQSSPSGDSGVNCHHAIIEVLFFVSALRRASAKTITAVIPYMSYLRQTQGYHPNHPRPIAAAELTTLLYEMGVDRVVFVDLHNQRVEGFFRSPLPVTNIQPQSLVIQYFKAHEGLVSPVVVATENSGGERAKAFWTRLQHAGVKAGFTTMVNWRPERAHRPDSPAPESEDVNAPIVNRHQPGGERDWLVGEVKDCDCIIVDDIIDTAEKATRAAKHLKKAGARRIFVYATHGLFSKGAIDLINKSPINEVVVTNSLPIPPVIIVPFGIPSPIVYIHSTSAARSCV